MYHDCVCVRVRVCVCVCVSAGVCKKYLGLKQDIYWTGILNKGIEQGYWTRVLNGGIERGYWTGVLNGGYWTMGTLLFNRVLNGVLNGISARACSIPKRFDSQPYIYIYIYISVCVCVQYIIYNVIIQLSFLTMTSITIFHDFMGTLTHTICVILCLISWKRGKSLAKPSQNEHLFWNLLARVLNWPTWHGSWPASKT